MGHGALHRSRRGARVKFDTVKSVLLLGAVGAAGYMAWRTYRGTVGAVDGAMQAAQQAFDQATANIQSAWVNNVSSPWQRGQDYMAGIPPVVSSKAWLYGDYQYTGIDAATGKIITDGEWYGNADARRYDAAQIANGSMPAATSIDGAAFGIYPRAFGARTPEQARQIDRIIERDGYR